MNKKQKSKDGINLFFSAFLIIAYVICGFFFSSFIATQSDDIIKGTLTSLIYLLFGLIVFYATRVGENKVIKRFSLSTLIVLDLPTLIIILMFIIPALPLHTEISANPAIAYLAAVALGYGIPYTFISGFEDSDPVEEIEILDDDDKQFVAGGIEEDVSGDEAEEETDSVEEEPEDEIVVEGEAIIDDVDAYNAQQQ